MTLPAFGFSRFHLSVEEGHADSTVAFEVAADGFGAGDGAVTHSYVDAPGAKSLCGTGVFVVVVVVVVTVAVEHGGSSPCLSTAVLAVDVGAEHESLLQLLVPAHVRTHRGSGQSV